MLKRTAACSSERMLLAERKSLMKPLDRKPRDFSFRPLPFSAFAILSLASSLDERYLHFIGLKFFDFVADNV